MFLREKLEKNNGVGYLRVVICQNNSSGGK